MATRIQFSGIAVLVAVASFTAVFLILRSTEPPTDNNPYAASQQFSDIQPMPDPNLTPGVSRPRVTAAQVCQRGYTKLARDVDEATKASVRREYGISRDARFYEIDHSYRP